MEDSSLKLNNINKKIGKFELKNIFLEVLSGEYFVILGPTGAGKTVLLEIIAGIKSPDTGEIFLGRKNITHLPPEKRKIGFVYQDYLLFPHLNVKENIIFGLKNNGFKIKQINDRLEQMAELLNIKTLINRSVNDLSGGEKQRIALARALIMEPEILLLDEPLSALDPSTKEVLQNELKVLSKNTTTIFIHVTHDFEEALYLGTRVGVVMNGELLQTGTPEEIFTHPNTSDLAHFVGAENIYESEIICKNNKKYIKLGMILMRVNSDLTGKIGFSIRPEYILISLIPHGENSLPGKVLEVLNRGLFVKVIIDIGDRLVALVPAREEVINTLTVGSTVYCFIPPEAINVFPL